MNAEDNKYTVYKHTSPSDKVYIGITRQRPEKRWGYGYGYKKSRNIYWHNAIKKYGWNNIKHEILLSGLSEDEAKQKEIELIAFYDSTNRDKGYNISPGGGVLSKESVRKAIRTKEKNGTFEKECERMKLLWENPEWRRNQVAKMQNKHRTEEQKEHYRKASAARKGKPLSPETKAKLSAVHKTRIGEKSSRKRMVYQINPMDGSIVKEYITARQAAIEVGAKPISAIAAVCRNGHQNKHQFKKGYYWCYADEYEEFSKTIELNPDTTKSGVLRLHPRVMCVETGIIYDSMTEAAKAARIKCESEIARQIYGDRKTVGGHTWRFVNGNGEVIEYERKKGTPCTGATKEAVSKARSKPVMCVETGEIFKNSLEAIRFVGLKESSAAMIKRQIDGKIKTVKGYTWKYV